MSRYRRAGARWRLLVHDIAPRGMSGVSRHFTSHPLPHSRPFAEKDPERQKRLDEARAQFTDEHVVSGTEFDELVVGSSLHIEQMDGGTYWMSIAGVVVWLRMDRDGKPRSVDVYGPGDYDAPVPGVTYGGPALSEGNDRA